MKAVSFECRSLLAQYDCPFRVVGDSAGFIGLLRQVQATVSQSSELIGAEVSGPLLRMDAGNTQRLTAEVIAHPGHNTLVLQQSHEAAAPVLPFIKPCGVVAGMNGKP
jgi:hypothetical protein